MFYESDSEGTVSEMDMKKTDLAYIAGIIDGEGCISIKKATFTGSRRKQYQIMVKVASTDEWLCRYLQMGFGAGQIRINQPPRNSNQFPVWDWRIYSREAYKILRLVLPYLKIKRPQAELAITFQEAKRFWGQGKTEEEWAIEEAQYILMSNLKRNKLSNIEVDINAYMG